MLAGAKLASIFRHFPRPSCAAFAKLKYRFTRSVCPEGCSTQENKKTNYDSHTQRALEFGIILGIRVASKK